jgi:hypothetical protein
LHDRYRVARVQGEWFALGEDVVEALAAYLSYRQARHG